MTRPRLLCKQAIAGWTLMLVPVLTATVATAQSLDDVARRESDRRTQAESGRVYTNASLARIDPPSPAPSPAVEVAEAPKSRAAVEPRPVVETDATTIANFQSANGPSERKDRNYWHSTAVALRERLARTKVESAAQREQLAAIGDRSQTPTALRVRDVISKTLTRLQREAATQELELTRFLTTAQLAKVPEEWLRE